MLLLLISGPGHAGRVPYPDNNVCERDCTLNPQPCPGQTCPGPKKMDTCNRYLMPTTDPLGPGRPFTYCMYDFDAPCTDDRLGCPRCALRYIAVRKCDFATERCVRPSKDYVVFPSREGNETIGFCYTDNQVMVVPTRPCTGIESPDPKCTGRQGEKYWAYAWKTAMERGLSPSGPTRAQWAVALSAMNGRSQHQAHFRVAPTIVTPGQIMERFIAQPALSTDAKNPTFTWGPGSDFFASVFVPGDVTSPGTVFRKVRPFQRASVAASAAAPLVAYGILLTPWQQPAAEHQARFGKKARTSSSKWGSGSLAANVTGFAVTAFFNYRTSLLLQETVSVFNNETCQPPCGYFVGTSAAAAAVAAAEAPTVVDPMSDTALFGW